MMRSSGSRILAASILLGSALRVAYLASRPIWYDEAFSILLARRSLPEILAGTAADTMPPFYYFILKAWMSFGSSIAFMRLLNVIIGIVLVLLTYALGRALFTVQAGAWGALLAAFSPFLVYHAQELRMYTLLAVALAAYALATYRYLWNEDVREDRGLWRFSAVTLSATAALYTHNLASFTVLAPNIFLLIRWDWGRQRRLLLAQITAAVLFLPWLVMVPGQIAKIQTAFWTPLPGLLEVVQAMVTLHTNLPLPQWMIPVALFGTLLSAALVAVGLVKAERSPAVGYLLAFGLIPPGALWIVSYFMRPLFVPRAFILSLPAVLLLFAKLIAKPPLKGLHVLLVVSFLVPAAISLVPFYSYESFPRSPFDRAGERLRASIGSGEVIVHDNKLSYFPMVVYQPELPMVFLADDPGSHNDTLAPETADALGLEPSASIESAVEGRSGVWFVVFQRAIEEYKQLGASQHPVIAWLQEHYQLRDQLQVGDLLLMHFVAERRTGELRPETVIWGRCDTCEENMGASACRIPADMHPQAIAFMRVPAVPACLRNMRFPFIRGIEGRLGTANTLHLGSLRHP